MSATRAGQTLRTLESQETYPGGFLQLLFAKEGVAEDARVLHHRSIRGG